MATSSGCTRSTLFVRNLPYSATKEDLESLFEEVGPLKQCFVITEKGVKDKCRGFGYVTFALRDDAEKAVKTTKSLNGRKLKLSFSDRKPRKGATKESNVDGPEAVKETTKLEDTKGKISAASNANAGKTLAKKTGRKKPRATEEPSEREKRKCRLIVRNLPFKCTEETLMSTFDPFGAVTEVVIPVKADSTKKLGFGFVQFDTLKSAAKALKQMNGKEIMGRVVAVDWTLPRAEYLAAVQTANKNSSETRDGNGGGSSGDEADGSDAKGSDDGEDDDDEDEDDEDDEDDDEDEDVADVAMQSEDDATEDSEEDDDDDDAADEEGDVTDEEGDVDDDEFEEEEETPRKAKAKQIPDDVQEGKTLFIRNVPYDAIDEDLADVFSQFGELEFCKVALDPMTEHSRGSAFVKFRDKEDAENCLKEASDGMSNPFTLQGRVLTVTPAISRAEAVKLRTAEKDKAKAEQKDKRNLHLLTEGMIRPGTKAAEGLPELYMQKRTKVETLKREKLRNVNIFVSPTRLVLHNLPKAVDAKQLRELVKDGAGNKNAKVIEARVMRDLSRPNARGVCKSLGFAFVEFTTHQHALAALHHLNSNASVFGPEKRLIVGFSLENKRALEIQKKRREKAVLKQEMFSKQDKPHPEDRSTKPYSQQKVFSLKIGAETQQQMEKTTVMPRDGGKKGLPRHFGAKNRWRDRGKVNDEKRKMRKEKRLKLQKEVWRSMKTPMPAGLQMTRKELKKEKKKSGKKRHGRDEREEKQFSALVNKYKKKLFRTDGSGSNKSTAKWFET